MESNHRFVFVIGPPGAGKGTLSRILARGVRFAHISVGDLLRQVASDPSTSNVVRGYIDCGGLLPSEHLFPILRARFRQCEPDQPIILDGFPRHLNQAVQFEREFGEPVAVLFFNCPRDLAKFRVLSRQAGRTGDTSEVFDRRFSLYNALNPAILDYYRREKSNLVEVDTSRDTRTSSGHMALALTRCYPWIQLLVDDFLQRGW
ncbi:Adenylate kinase 1 [Madurella mycetomatis]|uniref:Adenylate kinase 1 n=1 Tax=Madurella mycetomatis TaxID=100816 RepID=A0A175W0H7_9PEZI|nr:Adenylate kinase 1 [Madurella mycetomatis]